MSKANAEKKAPHSKVNMPSIEKSGLDVIDKIFTQWDDRLIPVTLERDKMTDKKKTIFPLEWKGVTFNSDFGDFDDHNSVALRTGEGIGVVDIDTKDLSLLNNTWKAWVRERLEKCDTLIVETYNGYHIYIDTDDFKLKSTTKEGADKSPVPHIDFRGVGGLIFVASTADRVSYKVISDSSLMEVNDSLKEMLPEKKERIEIEDDDTISRRDLYEKRSKQSVYDILSHINPSSDRDTWKDAMAGAYAMLDNDEDAEQVLLKWSQKGDNFDEKGFYQMFNQLVDGRFGQHFSGGSLLNDAMKNKLKKVLEAINTKESMDGVDALFKSKAYTSEPQLMQNDMLEEIVTAYNGKREAFDLPKLSKSKVLKLVKLTPASEIDEDMKGAKLTPEIANKFFGVTLNDIPSIPIDIKGIDTPIIYRGRFHIIYGIYGTYKTATAAYLAGRVSETQNMTAYHLDGELNGGNMKTLIKSFGVNYIPSDISEEKIDYLLHHQIDCSDAILILDSFHAMLPEGKSNNDATDTTSTMKKAVRLSNELGATVIVIEHATALNYGKDGNPDPISAKMEGSQGGKMKLCHMAYKIIPVGKDYKQGVKLQVARSREPDTTPMHHNIFVPYDNCVDELFDDITHEEELDPFSEKGEVA